MQQANRLAELAPPPLSEALAGGPLSADKNNNINSEQQSLCATQAPGRVPSPLQQHEGGLARAGRG